MKADNLYQEQNTTSCLTNKTKGYQNSSFKYNGSMFI